MRSSTGFYSGGKLKRDMMAMDMGNGLCPSKHERAPTACCLEPGEKQEVLFGNSRKRAALNLPATFRGIIKAGMYGEVNFNFGDSRVRSLADASKPLNMQNSSE